jgi:predicted nuclease of predicted toxin-antitoxin system
VIRFHLDESVDIRIGDGLRRRGVDVTYTNEVGLREASDAEQLQFALSEGRVIITCDADFVKFHREGIPHAGIIFCRSDARIGYYVNLLHFASQCLEANEMQGRLEHY